MRRAEDSVKELAGQLRLLAQNVVLAQEQERKRIARELHDEAGQALVALKFSLELLLTGLPPGLDEASENLTEAIRLMDTTRNRGLSSWKIDEGNHVGALGGKTQLQEMSAGGIFMGEIMKTGRFRTLIVSIVTLLLALTVFARNAEAHALDTGLVVQDARIGAYDLSVWCFSTVKDEAALHISAGLTDPETGAPIMGADVNYTIETLPEGQMVTKVAAGRPLPTNGFLFESNIPLSDTGSYRVTVEISDASQFGGTFVFVTNVYPISVWTQAFITGLLLIGIAAMIWLLREGSLILKKRKRA